MTPTRHLDAPHHHTALWAQTPRGSLPARVLYMRSSTAAPTTLLSCSRRDWQLLCNQLLLDVETRPRRDSLFLLVVGTQGKLPCPRSAKPHDADDLPAALRQCSGALLGRAPAATREPPQRLGEANLRGRPRCTHARHRTARRLPSVDAAGQLAGCHHTGARRARKAERGRRWRRHDPEALLL